MSSSCSCICPPCSRTPPGEKCTCSYCKDPSDWKKMYVEQKIKIIRCCGTKCRIDYTSGRGIHCVSCNDLNYSDTEKDPYLISITDDFGDHDFVYYTQVHKILKGTSKG